jgi:NAD(P)-dependent dehydrogenase (short-subunit alcohol dehydrogenase family)
MTDQADCAFVSGAPFAGRVIVVAGDSDRIDPITSTLLEAGAIVAVVNRTSSSAAVQAWFRVDPADPDVWSRVVPHVEQRLGPIDAAVTTTEIHGLVRDLLEPDMRRRGHGGVLDIDAAAHVDEAVRTLATLL